MRSVVTTSELSRSFGAIQAVGGVNLQIEEAEMFGLVGPDGAGKTTTLRMLCGILPPSSGTATVLGFDVMKEVAQIKRRIGYLSQRFTLYGDLTVDENIEFFAEIHGVWDFGPRREELLQFTRLTPFRDRLAERLSGGMKQKLALACTLIHRPQVIFLDEPTTGVDPVSRRDFWRILQSLVHEGITIVMSTPYLDEAERCTRVALMNAGTVMHMAPPMTLKEQMSGDVLEIHTDHVREGFALLKSSGTVREVQAFGDRLNVIVENADREAQTITALLRAHNISVTGCREIAPSLENVFISLLTKSKHNEVLP